MPHVYYVEYEGIQWACVPPYAGSSVDLTNGERKWEIVDSAFGTLPWSGKVRTAIKKRAIAKMKKDCATVCTLADCNTATATTTSAFTNLVYSFPVVAKQKEQETETIMYNDVYCKPKAATVTAPSACVNIQADAEWSKAKTAQEYLLDRLENARYCQRGKLDDVFKVYDHNYPKNLTEFLARMKDGKFHMTKDGERRLKQESVADDVDLASFCFGLDAFMDYIDWRETPYDAEAHAAARTRLSDGTRKAKDLIMIGTAEEGLKALQDFEAADFSKA